ncbi:hypothetical protein PanWU01x14_094690 [Parasponia andersonii]|uniref:Endonuclease/exonuclease/phosphatase n=1 Tax=Parasponia andersonii TaxID=3476 RepID=A0A2P5D5K2_PARAD|nr:hypothetical protein PanWU01x14_094690 [Parasponia andersonii]
MEEWRAQIGLTIDGLRKSPSRKRKAQPFILLIAHPSDMPQWGSKLDLANLTQAITFSHGSNALVPGSSTQRRWKQRARAKGKVDFMVEFGNRSTNAWGYRDRSKGVSTIAMILLAWKCRGMARTLAVQNLRALVAKFKPDVLVLSELMIKEDRNLTSSPRISSPALCTRIHQALLGVFQLCMDHQWLLVDVPFGKNYQDDESWSSGSSSGGFASSSVALRECLNVMGCVDLGRGGTLFQRARLDRAVATAELCELFPRALIKNVANVTSDHFQVILDTNGDVSEGVRPFRFEAMWTHDIRSHWVVKDAWSVVPNPCEVAG